MLELLYSAELYLQLYVQFVLLMQVVYQIVQLAVEHYFEES